MMLIERQIALTEDTHVDELTELAQWLETIQQTRSLTVKLQKFKEDV